ncbi:glycosyltransferase family 4 protein [uncultured Phascolarctobacterium sp.]|uniref:glycosyltransferase family 4 protein n=1 Tax=uncultured Phascolarctobacterium sp. TaxID=512296 RepID=UPI00260B9840|nr:glycosyltransferase family 4 protein [uncultured Phascolarctobacterium sp.]
MVKIGVCGHFGGGKNFLDGQTVKTKIVTKELQREFGNNEVKKVDTYGGKKRLFSIITNLIGLVISCKNVIIFPAQNSLMLFAPILAFINRFYHRKLHYVVIGGWLPEFVAKRKFLRKALMKFDCIYVETNTMKNKLEVMGFYNIAIMPNCKELNILKTEELVYAKEEPYKLCTFSRVMKEKGIEDAVDAVIGVNEELGRIVYTLDIYGQIDSNQVDWFKKLEERFPTYIQYKGLVDFDKTTQVLKDYFMLLFPTYYEGEGFAGTLIDAMAAGVPVIASDWRYNSEIVKDEKIGFIIKKNLKAELVKVLSTIDKVNDMKATNLVEAEKYLPKNAIKILFKKIER